MRRLLGRARRVAPAAPDVARVSAAYDLCGSCGHLLSEGGTRCAACGSADRLALGNLHVTDRLNDTLEAQQRRIPVRTQVFGVLAGSWAALGVVAASTAIDAVLWSALPAAGAMLAGGMLLPSKMASKQLPWATTPELRWRRPLPGAHAGVPTGLWNGVARTAAQVAGPLTGQSGIAVRTRAWRSDSADAPGMLVLDETRSSGLSFGRFTLRPDALHVDGAPASHRTGTALAGLQDDPTPLQLRAEQLLQERGFRTSAGFWRVEEWVVPANERIDIIVDADAARVRMPEHHLAVA